MINYYIIINKIIDENNLLHFTIYEFNPENSLKPIEKIVHKFETASKLIETIEIIFSKNEINNIFILKDDGYILNIFEDSINNYNHIQIKYSKEHGYRVIYKDKSDGDIELLDNSASGILKYLKKVKYGE